MTPTAAIADHPARILVVDDQPDNVELLEVILRWEGYLVVTAASGDEALAIVAQQPLDLILLDIMMPGLNGYQVAAKIKTDLATTNIPIIMVSAVTDRNARTLALGAGVDDFLTKPLHRDELVLRVRNLLHLKICGAGVVHWSELDTGMASGMPHGLLNS
jgi:DNA-binding response OmpR family regulator